MEIRHRRLTAPRCSKINGFYRPAKVCPSPERILIYFFFTIGMFGKKYFFPITYILLFDVFFTIFAFHGKELTHPGKGLGPDHQLRLHRPHPLNTVVANKVQRHCFFSSNIVQRYVYIIICIDILPAAVFWVSGGPL